MLPGRALRWDARGWLCPPALHTHTQSWDAKTSLSKDQPTQPSPGGTGASQGAQAARGVTAEPRPGVQPGTAPASRTVTHTPGGD